MIKELKAIYHEVEARKRAEIEQALRDRDVADPITIGVVTITWQSIAISAAVSAAVSAATFFLSRALAPKPPKQTQGKLTGSLQLQNSEQGIFIPEIYGGSPNITGTLVAGANPTYQNVTNATTGANGSITKTGGSTNLWDSGATHNVAINSGDEAFYKVIRGSGHAAIGFFTTASPGSGGGLVPITGFLFGAYWTPDGALNGIVNGAGVGELTHTVSGDKITVEVRGGTFKLYKNNSQLANFSTAIPLPTYPLYAGIVMYTTGSGISDGKVQINNIGVALNGARGGIKIPAIIVWSSGIRKLVSTTQVQTGGGKGGGGRTQTVDNISYDIDLGMMFCRGPVSLIREYANADILIDQFDQSPNPSGVYDSTVGADSTYDPLAPPDPTINYLSPINRVDADIPYDGDGVGTGMVQGGGSGFAIYPGNATQQADPTIEADTDGKYGAGSTPAYRNHSLVVHNALSLSRWGGAVPNITAVWEHQTLRTLDTIFASLCERVNVKTANSDYDFTGLSAIQSRGMLISGRPFQPAEVIGSPDLQLAYNYFVTEKEGQIVGYAEGTEPSITIADTEVGWLDSEEVPDILPEVDSILAPEISLAREVHVKSLDPDNDWEPNTASAMRQITDGSTVELLEIQIAQLSDERRETAQRKLYRDYVAGTAHKFTLPWTYLYLYPGYKITITRAEGFTHVLRLTSISGGVGVLSCEGVALEPETFNQPAVGVFPPGYIPPQPIPAMTVLSLLDTPLLRDGDITNNDGVGWYMCGTPRTGVNQNWTGFGLYAYRGNEWQLMASSNIAGTIGTVVSVSLLSTDPTTIDHGGRIVIDLYGTSATLASVTEADITAGANLAVVGNMVFNFATATQVAGFANRWELSVLLNGQKETDEFISLVAAGDRFVFVDDAVKFVPMLISDLNNSETWKAVTSGQSLADAAPLTAVWTGNGLKAHKISDLSLFEDGSNDWAIQFVGHERTSEAPASFVVEVWADATRDNPANLKRSLPVTYAAAQAALLIAVAGSGGDIGTHKIAESAYTDKNSVLSVKSAATLRVFNDIYTRLDFTFQAASAPTISTSILVRLWENNTFDPPTTVLTADTPVSLRMAEGPVSGVRITVDSYTTTGIATLDYSDAELIAGLRFSILIVGNEYRIYKDYAFGASPLVVIATPGTGPTFPLRGVFDASSGVNIVKIGIANGIALSTIYALREQTIDFGGAQSVLNLRVYQKGLAPKPNGWPVDVAVQTFGGMIMLESGGTDNLLLEDGTNLLKE